MKNFKELHDLITLYSKEISKILSEITTEDLKDLEYLYYKLNNECTDRQVKLNSYIHSKYPLENPRIINGIPCNSNNTILNFSAQYELSKRYSEFHTLCHEYFQRFEQDCSDKSIQ